MGSALTYQHGHEFLVAAPSGRARHEGSRLQARQDIQDGWKDETEGWSECRKAMLLAEQGRHVKPFRRTVGGYLMDEWLPAIMSSTASTTLDNWRTYAKAYVVPKLGKVELQALTAPQLQALYDFLLEHWRIKADLSATMDNAWKSLRQTGREPTARQVAEASGATSMVR